MIKRYPKFTFYLLLLPALVLFCCLTTSCKTTEDDLANNSDRPWNSPCGWDSNLPAQMLEGR